LQSWASLYSPHVLGDPAPDTDRLDRDPSTDDGVDVTLIRWMLRLTPAERLQVLQDSVDSLIRLRDHARRT